MTARDESVLVLAPVHLRSKDSIAETFGVAPCTVVEWAREGAPIFLAGNRYQAEYYSLIHWLNKNRPVPKKPVNSPVPHL